MKELLKTLGLGLLAVGSLFVIAIIGFLLSLALITVIIPIFDWYLGLGLI